MLREFTIWDSRISPEEADEMVRLDMEEYPEKYAKDKEQAAYVFLKEWKESELRDERAMLYLHLENPILAACCHWGTVTSYRVINPGVVRDILYPFYERSACRWYCDGQDICKDETVGEVTEHYIYREVRNNRQIQKLLHQIEAGGASLKMFRKYTQSIAPVVAREKGYI